MLTSYRVFFSFFFLKSVFAYGISGKPKIQNGSDRLKGKKQPKPPQRSLIFDMNSATRSRTTSLSCASLPLIAQFPLSRSFQSRHLLAVTSRPLSAAPSIPRKLKPGGLRFLLPFRSACTPGPLPSQSYNAMIGGPLCSSGVGSSSWLSSVPRTSRSPFYF